METDANILGIHCRMARAALQWSIERLSKEAGVGVNTVSRLENGDADANAESLMRIGATFRQAGIQLINEDGGGGPGARLAQPTIQIIRQPTWHPTYERLAFRVAYRSKKVVVFLGRAILDDRDRYTGRCRTPQKFVESFERHRALILRACEKGIDGGRVEHDDHLYLRESDFP